MNSITKKMLLAVCALLLTACVHYPRQYSYYPGNAAYSNGYTIMHRNYYGERPDHYDNGYGRDKAYFPPHQRHDQYNALPHWGSNHSGYQHDGSHDHPNSRRHDDDDSHHHNFDRGNHH